MIDNVAHTINTEFVTETDFNAITPQFTVSEGATANPVTGSTGVISEPSYVIAVTAEDGTVQDWTVNVTKEGSGGSSENDILTYISDWLTGPAVIDNCPGQYGLWI